MYLDQEWGKVYDYLKRIKEIFDPEDVLNPGTMFNTENKKITDDLKFPAKFINEVEWPCMECGYYNGEEVIKIETLQERKKRQEDRDSRANK